MSWNLLKGEDYLPRISEVELERLYRLESGATPKLRLLCALQRKRGESIDSIADNIRIPRRTVHKYLWRFEEKGIEGKDTVKKSGRKPILSARQQRALVRELEKGSPHNRTGLWSSKEVRQFIEKKFGVTFVSQHVWRILIASGFSVQRARPRHYKTASPDEIRRFKKKPNASSATTKPKALSWAQKTKQHSGSSRSLHEAGRKKEANQP